jgi:hypothetical protein
MRTILFVLFASFLLILLTQWSQADFFLTEPEGVGADTPGVRPELFAYDIRLNTFNGRKEIVRQGALDAMKQVFQGWYTGASALAGSIEVEYFHVQLGEYNAAVHIRGGSRMNYGSSSRVVEWRGAGPITDGRDNFSARIKILPRIFDEQAYWIAAENRWAETAVEAVKNVVLEGLVHVERYMNEKVDRPVRLLASLDVHEN